MSSFCTHCGSRLPPGAAFCDACGQALLPAEFTETASAHTEHKTQPKEEISKRGALFAAAMVALFMVIFGSLLWPSNGSNSAVRTKESDALTTIMGQWASTPGGSVAVFQFTPETMTVLGQTFNVNYMPIGDSISVSVGNPPRELAKLSVVTPKEIRFEGAATVRLYRIH